MRRSLGGKSKRKVSSSLLTTHYSPDSLASSRAQATLEYAVFTAVVAAALMAMNVYVRRAIQANLKQVQDQVNAEAVQP